MEKIKSRIKNPLFVVIYTVFIDLIGVGILIPIIPQLLGNPNSSFYLLPAGLTINDGFILLGFLTAIYPIMQFISTPILGQLSDKYGRKPILLISLLGTCLSYVVFAIGILNRNIPLLFISRAFDGITGGNIAVAQAAIADITTPKNRAKNFGLIGAAFGLGFVVGPYIGGKLSDPGVLSWFDATTPFYFAAILSFINIVSVMAIFPETNIHKDKTNKLNWSKSVLNIIHAFNLKEIRSVLLANFVYFSGFTFFTTFAGVYFSQKYHWDQGNIGDFFAYVGIWIIISQAVVTRNLANYLKEYQVLKFSYIGTGLGILGLFLANEWWQMLFIVPFFAIFNGLSMANSGGLISRSVDNKIQGEVLGISSSVQALAQSIPPILSGYIAVSLNANAPILVSSIVMVIAGILFILIYRKNSTLDLKNEDDLIVAAH